MSELQQYIGLDYEFQQKVESDITSIQDTLAGGLGERFININADSLPPGTEPVSTGQSSIVIGPTSSADSNSNIAIGVSTVATGDFAVAIGNLSNSGAEGAVSIGANSGAGGLNAIAIGRQAFANSSGGTSVGNLSSSGTNSVALGRGSNAGGDVTVAIGFGTDVEGDNCIGVGPDVIIPGNDNIAIGFAIAGLSGSTDNIFLGSLTTTARGVGNVCMGTNVGLTNGNKTNGVLIGSSANAGTNDSIGFPGVVGIGWGATASAESSVAVGHDSVASDVAAVAMGLEATASGLAAVALGGNTQAQGDNSIAIGANISVIGMNSVQLGPGTLSAANTLQFQDVPISDNNGLIIPGPFADDTAASGGGVALNKPYYTATGEVRVRVS